MLMTYIKVTNSLLLIFCMFFIVKHSGNFYDDYLPDIIIATERPRMQWTEFTEIFAIYI